MRNIFYLLIVILLVNVVLQSSCTLSVRETNKLEVIGHRGDPYTKVENTIESIRSGLKLGNAVEVDLQLTKDGVIVLYHDDYLGGAGFSFPEQQQKQLSEYTLDELQKITFDQRKLEEDLSAQTNKEIMLLLSSDPQIAKLDEILPIPRGKKMYLELKCSNMSSEYKTRLAYSISGWVERNMVSNQIVITSFDPECLLNVSKINPDVMLGIASTSVTVDNFIEVVTLENSHMVDYLFPPYKISTKDLVKSCKESGVIISPWVWDEDVEQEKEELNRLILLGVDGLITNQPDELSMILSK